MNLMEAYIKPVVQLFFTNLCESCGNELLGNERIACLSCMQHLGRTNFHLQINNPVEQKFWGRIPFEYACSLFYFSKDNTLQHLLHALKYRGKEEIGIMLGTQCARIMEGVSWLADIDLVVPVPLAAAKRRLRGYNQSELIAKGFSGYFRMNLECDTLVRIRNTSTQTNKSRSERIENVKHAFSVRDTEIFRNKHILLIDDVVTTGATIEACSEVLTSIPDTRVSILTLGYATE